MSNAEVNVPETGAFQRSKAARDARSQIVPGHTLPQYYYLSPDQFRRDIDVLSRTQWLLVEHASSVPKPGDFVVHDTLGESVIILRDRQNRIRAFYNVCRHRGSRICTEARGHASLLTCPYHSWSYDLNGALRAARDMPADFNPTENGLRECHVGAAHGLIFLNLAPSDPPDFEAFSGRFGPYLQRYGIARAKVAQRRTYRVAANWKAVAENNLECYHCTHSHPELFKSNPGLLANEDDTLRNWRKAMADRGALLTEFMDDADSPHFQIAQSVGLGNGAVSSSLDGKPVARLMGELTEYTDAAGIQMFNPLSGVGSFSDYSFAMRFIPRAPSETDYEVLWLVDEKAIEGVDYNVEQLCAMWDVTTQEDKELVLRNQAGIESRAYSPGRFSVGEFRVAGLTDWYVRHFVDTNDSAKATST
jgi:phenylpropionate dioxygenase-like ring-hydroxylating dioxygenase large terminal subunit